MKTKKLVKFLEQYLEVNRFHDYCPNGIQVESNSEIKKIALGVSASLKLFKKAKSIHADTVIVHHGLFWGKSNQALKGILGKRIRYLYKNNLTLFGYHLPLDYHSVTGNNACISDALGLESRTTFAKHGGMEIGIMGKLPESLPVTDVKNRIMFYLGQINQCYFYGKKKIRTIAVVSGGAPQDIYEAYDLGADLYITGEVNEPMQEWCKEAKMNCIAAGHYASEQFGIQSLGKIISKEFHIKCVYIPVQNKV